MKKTLVLSTLLLCLFAPRVLAAGDPLGVPNNRVGVHILDTGELDQAAKLVNSNGGDWGYVTVVLRSNDFDRAKWSQFFIDCRRLHIIPIVRIATYPDGGTWVKPDAYDLVDFANFLGDMPWPTKNRYVILFNEVNRANEWGNSVSPTEYSQIVSEAAAEFKTRSADFFLISAGLDMAAPNSGTSEDALTYYRQMGDWLGAVDGIGVHAYSNPGFTAPLNTKSRQGIVNYRFIPGSNTKPLFITETGWPSDSPFYTAAFSQYWTDANIVAVTPFLLHAASGDFAKFSLLDAQMQPKNGYREIADLPKLTGSPQLSSILTLPDGVVVTSSSAALTSATPAISLWNKLTKLWADIRGLTTIKIGSTNLQVETADTEAKRTQGLSDRLSMNENEGMLFKFDNPGIYMFWMKDMRFPLDFIWIRGDKVVQIDKNIDPPGKTYGIPAIITPHEKIDQVLEVNAGWADKYGIKEGDIVTHEQD